MISAALIVASSLSTVAPAPVEEALARETCGEMVIDGRADEADWARAPWLDRFVDITGNPEKAPTLRTRAKLLWSEDYLYVFADLEEPNVVATLTNRDDIVWHENDFEIFIDPDGDGENYFEFEFNAANTLFDLFLTRPYSDKRGTFVMHQWNAEGLKSATSRTKDGWTLEVAIPNAALANGFELPLKAHREIRIGFSRVEWLNEKQEENWTWGATGKVDMHIPSRWGKVMLMPKDFTLAAWLRRPQEMSGEDLGERLKELKELGFGEICLDCGSFDRSRHAESASIAKSLGLTYHAWVTTLIKTDAPREWYTVNRLGESAADVEGRAYVPYYATLDPHNPDVIAYLVEKCGALAEERDIDFVQLDYIRYADVILPEALWEKYGVDGREEPKADACYCKAYCAENYSREEALSSLVNRLSSEIRAKGKKISVDVFPGPDTYARRMVRQDWSKWHVDAIFAMNYNDFYLRNVEWIGTMVREERSATPDGARLICGVKVARPIEHDGGYVDPERLGLSSEDLRRAIRLAIAEGADGLAVFTPDDLTDEHMRMLKKEFP